MNLKNYSIYWLDYFNLQGYNFSHIYETVRNRVLKRNAFIDGLQSGVLTFLPRGLSQTAFCDGQGYTVEYDEPQPKTQANTFALV